MHTVAFAVSSDGNEELPFFLDGVQCTGEESHILSCNNTQVLVSDCPNDYAGVICSPGKKNRLSVRDSEEP